MSLGAGFSRCTEDLLVASGCFLLFGRVLVSLIHSSFPFPTLQDSHCIFYNFIWFFLSWILFANCNIVSVNLDKFLFLGLVYWIGLTNLKEGKYRWSYDQTKPNSVPYLSGYGSKGTHSKCVMYNNRERPGWYDNGCNYTPY